MLLGFLLATLGSFVGALVAGLMFARSVGPETWKLAGQFTGTFVGGSVNFVAIGRALDTDPSLFAAATVADNLSTAPWMLAQVALYPILARHFRAAPGEAAISGAAAGLGARLRDEWSRAEISIAGLAVLGALPLAIVWTSARLAQLLPGFPTVLWQTTLALVVAQVPAIRRVAGPAVLAYFALHLFFLVIGASAVVGELVRTGGVVFLFMIVVLTFHAVIVYGGGRLVGLDLDSLTIASQGAVGGPGTALALAVSMKRPSLVAPGILLGILGYAAGNYLGFACAWLTRALLG